MLSAKTTGAAPTVPLYTRPVGSASFAMALQGQKRAPGAKNVKMAGRYETYETPSLDLEQAAWPAGSRDSWVNESVR